jgi:hypothetical protein
MPIFVSSILAKKKKVKGRKKKDWMIYENLISQTLSNSFTVNKLDDAKAKALDNRFRRIFNRSTKKISSIQY